MMEKTPESSVDTKKSEESPSFYSTEETDYLLELRQLVEPFPSGDYDAGNLGIRTFNLITGKIVMGIVISELPDSFLTVLPFSMNAEDNGSLSMRRLAPSATCRLYKTSIGLTSIASPVFTLPYLKELKRNMGELPGFFNELRSAQLDSLIIQLDQTIPDLFEDIGSYGDKVGASPGSFTPPEFFDKKMKH